MDNETIKILEDLADYFINEAMKANKEYMRTSEAVFSYRYYAYNDAANKVLNVIEREK